MKDEPYRPGELDRTQAGEFRPYEQQQSTMSQHESQRIEVLQKVLSMTDEEKREIEEHGTMTDAELDAFDQRAREQFEQSQRMTAELRQMREQAKPEEDPAPGSDAAKELIRDAIRQGHTTENE